MTNTIRYYLEDYQRILKEGFNFDIPAYTNNTINALADEVGAPTYIKTPEFFIKRQEEYDNINSTNFLKSRRNKKYKIQEISDDDWENIRVFQATEIKQKSDYEKQLDSIRTILNRVTKDTFEDELDNLTELIKNDDKNINFMKDVAELIISFATSNSFYSNIYADIYCKFLHQYDTWKEVLIHCFKNYKESMKNIEFYNSEENYDKFCESNKINLNRRALSAFFGNMFEYKGVNKTDLINCILEIQKLVKYLIREEKKREEVAELTENIVILLNIVWEDLNKDLNENENEKNLLNEIVRNILNISRLKPLVQPNVSLTHKVIFKHIDLIKSLTII